jgi:hypothetical protein
MYISYHTLDRFQEHGLVKRGTRKHASRIHHEMVHKPYKNYNEKSEKIYIYTQSTKFPHQYHRATLFYFLNTF